MQLRLQPRQQFALRIPNFVCSNDRVPLRMATNVQPVCCACANLSEQMDTWYPKWQVTSDYRNGLAVWILVPCRCRARWLACVNPRCWQCGTVEQQRSHCFCPHCLSFSLSYIIRNCLEMCNRKSVDLFSTLRAGLLEHIKSFNSVNLENALLGCADSSTRALMFWGERKFEKYQTFIRTVEIGSWMGVHRRYPWPWEKSRQVMKKNNGEMWNPACHLYRSLGCISVCVSHRIYNTSLFSGRRSWRFNTVNTEVPHWTKSWLTSVYADPHNRSPCI